MTSSAPGPGVPDDAAVAAAAREALALVADGARVGLGTGRAASAFIDALGARVREGLRVTGVPTSRASAARARAAGIPLAELGGPALDLTVDGADEVAPNLDMIKGWGGALVRERIVANASARQVILVGVEKLVATLGERGRIPVEVVPGAVGDVMRAAGARGLVPTLRAEGGAEYVTDNGNRIVDVAPRERLRDAAAARALERALLAIPGVVDTGLFLGTAERVLVGHADGSVEQRVRASLPTE